VIDYSRHMHKVLGIDAGAGTARIQPGLVLAALQKAAAPHDLRFGPDPSTHNRATLGGMIGNNACGSRALAYGRTSDNVYKADVLFGNGERATLTNDAKCLETSSTASRLATLVSRNLATVRTSCGRFPRQGSGYALEHLLPERMSPVQAYAGTEGTWGQLLEATVRLVPRPSAPALLVVGYPSMADAADAAPVLVPFGPVAIEGLDSRIVDIVVATHGPSAVPPLPRGAGWLMVEVGGDTLAEALERAHALVADAAPRGAAMVCHDPTSPSRPSPGSRPSWDPTSRRSRSPPATVKACGLSMRTHTSSRGGARSQLGHRSSGSPTGRAGTAKRERSNSRSTTTATHQPVMSSRRSSKRPPLMVWLRPPQLPGRPALRAGSRGSGAGAEA